VVTYISGIAENNTAREWKRWQCRSGGGGSGGGGSGMRRVHYKISMRLTPGRRKTK